MLLKASSKGGGLPCTPSVNDTEQVESKALGADGSHVPLTLTCSVRGIVGISWASVNAYHSLLLVAGVENEGGHAGGK